MTIDGQGLGFSSFSIPGLAGSNKGFTATFDYELFDSEGANPPADGFSFNFGSAELGELGSAEEGMTGKTANNLSFEIDTWQNNDAEQGVNISGVVDGEDIGNLAFTNGVILEDNSRKTGSVEIRWDPSKGATFYTTGLTTNADFTDVSTSDTGFIGDDEFTFNFSARVGGANQDLFIDNLVIVAGKPKPAPFQLLQSIMTLKTMKETQSLTKVKMDSTVKLIVRTKSQLVDQEHLRDQLLELLLTSKVHS